MSKAPETTIERIHADAAQRRADAGVRYAALLLRNSAPHDGDSEELAAVMAVLSRGPADLEGDLAVVHSIAALEAAEQAEREFAEPWKMAFRAAKEVRAREEDKLSKARTRCEAAIRTAQEEASRIRGRLDAAQAERGRHWDTRNAWEAIVEGLSIDEVRARRRVASRRSVIRPEPATVESEPVVSEAVARTDEPAGP